MSYIADTFNDCSSALFEHGLYMEFTEYPRQAMCDFAEVICDERNNTPDIANNVFNIWLKPASITYIRLDGIIATDGHVLAWVKL